MASNVLKSIYYARIYTLITYSNPIWCTAYTFYPTPLRLQLKKSVKLFKETKILKLDDITKMTTATLMHKNKSEMFEIRPSHNHSNRHCHNLTFPTYCLSKLKHLIIYLGTYLGGGSRHLPKR